MKKKIRSKDIAAKLGVSGTLVSLVLNNRADQFGIKKETQEKVLFLARQMGYFNTEGRIETITPVEEKPGIIGMIVPSLNDQFVILITPFLQKAFSSIGLGFSIITKDPDDFRYERLTGSFKKFYSGLILVSDAADDNTIRNLRSGNYPFVILEKSLKDSRINTIYTDPVSASKMVSDHIRNLGYKNIIIAYDRKEARSVKVPLNILCDTINQQTCFNKPVIIDVDNDTANNELNLLAIEKFLRPPFRADIIITMNCSLVYPLLSQFQKLKIRIPQDVALISMEEGIGFDLVYPTITCIRKPVAGIATKIANMIWSEVKNSGSGKYKRQVTISPELVIRNSCGTIKSS